MRTILFLSLLLIVHRSECLLCEYEGLSLTPFKRDIDAQWAGTPVDLSQPPEQVQPQVWYFNLCQPLKTKFNGGACMQGAKTNSACQTWGEGYNSNMASFTEQTFGPGTAPGAVVTVTQVANPTNDPVVISPLIIHLMCGATNNITVGSKSKDGVWTFVWTDVSLCPFGIDLQPFGIDTQWTGVPVDLTQPQGNVQEQTWYFNLCRPLRVKFTAVSSCEAAGVSACQTWGHDPDHDGLAYNQAMALHNTQTVELGAVRGAVITVSQTANSSSDPAIYAPLRIHLMCGPSNRITGGSRSIDGQWNFFWTDQSLCDIKLCKSDTGVDLSAFKRNTDVSWLDKTSIDLSGPASRASIWYFNLCQPLKTQFYNGDCMVYAGSVSACRTWGNDIQHHDMPFSRYMASTVEQIYGAGTIPGAIVTVTQRVNSTSNPVIATPLIIHLMCGETNAITSGNKSSDGIWTFLWTDRSLCHVTSRVETNKSKFKMTINDA